MWAPSSDTMEYRKQERAELALLVLKLRIELNDVFGIRLDFDLYGRAFLQVYLVTTWALERVLDTNLTIQMVSPFDRNLCFLGFERVRRLDDFFYRAGQSDADFFGSYFCYELLPVERLEHWKRLYQNSAESESWPRLLLRVYVRSQELVVPAAIEGRSPLGTGR